MAFTHDTSTDEGLLRTLIYDTDSFDYYFEDDELSSVLDLNGSDLWLAAADCCRAIAAKLSRSAFKIGLGKKDIEIDKTKTPDFYIKLASIYDRRSDSGSSEYIDAINYEIDTNGNDYTEYVGEE